MLGAVIASRSLARIRTIAVLLAAAFTLAACADPNYIGVQDFGSVTGYVVDQNNKPIPNAIVQITGGNSSSGSTGANGIFNIENVAAGEQTITAVTAAGYEALGSPITVVIAKGDTTTLPSPIVLQSALPPT